MNLFFQRDFSTKSSDKVLSFFIIVYKSYCSREGHLLVRWRRTSKPAEFYFAASPSQSRAGLSQGQALHII